MSTEDAVPPDVLARFADLGRAESTAAVLQSVHGAQRLGISVTDHKAFELVCRHRAPLAAGRIAELTGLSTGAVTGVIDRLERMGLVRRLRDPADRRRVLVEAMPGTSVPADPAGSTERVLAEFTPAEREVIERFLRRRLEVTGALDQP